MEPSRKRVLLIHPKDSYALSSPPLGIGYLISYANAVNKNDVYFHDENFLDNAQLDFELDRTMEKVRPDFIGITFPSSTVKRVAELFKYIRNKYGDIILFAGGYHPTSEPEAVLRIFPELDFIILGQAEYSFAPINDNWKELPSVAYLVDGSFVQKPIENPIGTLDNIPFINRSLYDKRYFQPSFSISGIFGKTATIMTSRGCPYHCSFCSNKLLQKKVLFHGVDYVLGELDNLRTQIEKIDYIFFLDVMFLADWARTQRLCEALIKSKILKGVKWAATVSANVVTFDKVKLMKKAGCFYLSFGFESNSEHALKLMHKTATPRHNEQAMEICDQLGILANSAFLFGIPDETEKDLEATIQFVARHNVFSTGVNIMKPLPGSPYYYELVDKGLIKQTIDDWHAVSSINHFSGYFNDKISPETYELYTKKFYNTIRFKSKISYYRANLPKLAKYFFM
jgi:anaerobic magnesium-protoporphyrin IX monomethyl ester cyclase